MASYDISDYDIYKYSLILRPDGVVANAGGTTIETGKPLKSDMYFPIPSNFFVFPNTKCYFMVDRIKFGALDAHDLLNAEGVNVFLGLDLSSKYNYSNFNHDTTTADADTLTTRPQSAIIPLELEMMKFPIEHAAIDGVANPTETNIDNGARAILRDKPFVCITPPFGQSVNFQIKTSNLAPIFTTDSTVVTYDCSLQTFDAKEAVSLSFSILVHKNKEEKHDEKRSRY